MTRVREAIRRLLRGPRSSALLERFGMDPRRYWLLVDLFGDLSERGGMLDQLGANQVALGTVVRLYAVFTAFIAIALLIARASLTVYGSIFLVMTAFLLLSILLSETANSLVNPSEGLILAHQPVNGATYTAAKLTHLARIIVHLVPALNAVPALIALAFPGVPWFYPLIHLSAALAIGGVAALLCCALYGWLIRWLPARRLKAAGQLAGTLPMLAMMAWQPLRDLLKHLDILRWLPEQPAARWALGTGVGIAVAIVVVEGLRCLSADYLIRLSGILHGGSARPVAARTSRIGGMISGRFGGQPGRAGFVFVSRMALRDFQFRRQMVAVSVPLLAGLGMIFVQGWRTGVFSGRFTPLHLWPHLLGSTLFLVCVFLPNGSDFKGAWIFLSAPAEALDGFARGIHAALWIGIILVPHLASLVLLAWVWGIWQAGLFVAFSAAASSVYLALEIRLIEGVPFSKQVDPQRGAVLLPYLMGGGLAIALAVALQYLVVFRSPARVALAAVALGIAAWLLTRSSIRAFAAEMRYSLGLLSAETGSLYKEINI